MKKFFALVPLLAIIVAGCSLTQNAVNNQTSTKSPLTEQEKTDNAKIEEWKKQLSEQTKETGAVKTNTSVVNATSTTSVKDTSASNSAQLADWEKQVSEQKKENINTPLPAKNTSTPAQPGLTVQDKEAQLEAWKKQVSEQNNK